MKIGVNRNVLVRSGARNHYNKRGVTEKPKSRKTNTCLMAKSNGVQNAPSKTGNPSGPGRGNNPPSKPGGGSGTSKGGGSQGGSKGK